MSMSKADCLKILQDYVPSEFESLSEDDIIVTTQTGGLINTLTLITRKSDNYKVIIRQYGGNMLDVGILKKFRCPLSWQILIFQEISRLKIGPKLLGIFDNGRIEQYILSHTLTPEEFNQDEILHDLAINTAIIHNLKIPLKQTPFVDNLILDTLYQEFLDKHSLDEFYDKYENSIINCGADISLFKQLIFTDWIKEEKEINSITKTFRDINGLCLYDNNFLNVLVRQNPIGR